MNAPPVTHLDTHVACWLYNGDLALLSDAARTAIEAGTLQVSPMVELEIQYLNEIGRFRDEPSRVLGVLANDLGVSVSPAPFARVIACAQGLTWTQDVFDRLIAAQALHDGAVLVTRDRRIRENFSAAVW